MNETRVNPYNRNILFEPVSEEDVQSILDIYTFYVLISTATFHTHVPSVEEMREILFFTNKRNKSFTIRVDGCIYGYVILGQHSKREAYEDTGSIGIYLKHDACGKGLGGAAIDFIEEYARQMGFHTLLSVICEENTNSIRLFERKGYTKCAHYRELGRKFGRWLDIVAYQKTLH